MRTRLKKWYINGSLFLISTVLSFLLLEFILNSLGFRHDPIKDYYVNDKVLGFDIVPNFPVVYDRLREYRYKVWSNELGCFDMPYRGEKDYVLLLGDSFTWGFAPFESKYGTLLESYLSLRFLKCGVGAYSTRQELLKAKKIVDTIKTKPRLIVVGYCLDNDWEDYCFPLFRVWNGHLVGNSELDLASGRVKYYTDAEIKAHERISSVWFDQKLTVSEKIKETLRTKSLVYREISQNALIRRLGEWLHLCRSKEIFTYVSITHLDQNRYPWLSGIFKVHFNSFDELKQLASQYQAKLLIVLIPSANDIYDFLKEKDNYGVAPFGEKVKAFLKSRNIEHIDLVPYFREYAQFDSPQAYYRNRGLYLPYDGHWNIRGNKLAALLIARHIIEKRMVVVSEDQAVLNRISRELTAMKCDNIKP